MPTAAAAGGATKFLSQIGKGSIGVTPPNVPPLNSSKVGKSVDDILLHRFSNNNSINPNQFHRIPSSNPANLGVNQSRATALYGNSGVPPKGSTHTTSGNTLGQQPKMSAGGGGGVSTNPLTQGSSSSATGKTVRFSEKVGESSTKAPYNPRAFEQHLNNTYGAENVNSSTLLRPSERMVHMASQRHPVTGIVYDVKGNPIFDPVAVFDVKFPSSKALEVMPDTHKAMATRELAKVIEGNPALKAQFNAYQLQDIAAGERTIEGYIWHHHQDIGRMQLIPDSLHIKTGHVGEDLWRRGLDNAK